MKNILFDFKMYGALARISLHGLLQYRADFWASLFGVFVLNGANIAQMGIIAWEFTSLGSWGVGDLMLLYGLYMVSFSLASIFFSNVMQLDAEVMSGAFDRFLLRPMGAFMQLVGGEIKYVGLSDTLLGVILIALGKSLSGITWGLADALWLAIFLLCGGAVIVCLRTLISCVAFWVVKSSALQSVLMQLTLLTQKYPVSIFGDVFRAFVTGVIPIAFMNYYPAVLLLRKADAPAWLCLSSPLVALTLILLTALVWSRGIRRYSSAGG